MGGLHAADCRIVTRFNTHLTVEEERPVPPTPGDGGVILSDRVGRLPERQAGRRRNPFQAPVREVTVRIETGTVLRILSNDLDAPAQDIADLYKRRWAIELFFRWVKQTLKIRHFVGTSENAVRIQIAVALIAFVLLHLPRPLRTPSKAAHLRPPRPHQSDPPPPHRSVAPARNATEKATDHEKAAGHWPSGGAGIEHRRPFPCATTKGRKFVMRRIT